jgi:outer membrane protein OmpA-like peptidoglycan-associated protein
MKGTAEFKGCPTAFASEVKSNNDGLEGEEVQGELKFKVAKVTKDVTFDTKSTSVKSNFKVELDALAKALNENTKLVVALHGHCDNVGEDALNNSLSTERAQSVKDYLVSKGVNASRITTKGHGTSLPKVSNDTEKGRATNRRVEFVVKSK